MSDLHEKHPSAEELLEFAEGRLADPRSVEAHMNACPECARSVVAARQLRCLDEGGLIPPLSDVEVETEKARLRKWLRQGGLKKSGGGTGGSTILASLAGLAATMGVGHPATGPKPMLAGHEDPDQEIQNEAETRTDDPHDTNFQNSLGSDVTLREDAASTPSKEPSEPPNEVAEMLAKMEEILKPLESSSETDFDGRGTELSLEPSGTSIPDSPNSIDEITSITDSMTFDLPGVLGIDLHNDGDTEHRDDDPSNPDV